MKKTPIVLIIALMILCLAACGQEAAPPAEETPDPAALNLQPMAPVLDAEEDASADQAAALEVEVPASATDAALDPEVYAAAQACVGLTVEELFDAIGEPTGESRYAASCLEEGAGDGMLFYDGFYIWTLRTETEETVHDVYLLD